MTSVVNPDLLLALDSAPPAVRPALHALWALDEALGKVLATGREPMISRIRLAWWREALERLDREPAPAEPVLKGIAQHVLAHGVTGTALAEMEEAWSTVVTDQPLQPEELAIYAQRRGGLMFRFSARLLGREEPYVELAGKVWALVDLARHSSEPADIEMALAAARERVLPKRWPRPLRPLGMIAVLADRDRSRGPSDWEEPGAPPRTARMLRHRLTGW